MTKTYEFDALIHKHETLDSGYIEFPYDAEAEFGTKGQVKVLARFDGHPYRGSLVRMGHPCHFLGMTQEIRRAIGKNPGDWVHVAIERDDQPRTVELPEDFAAALDAPARQFFDGLSFTRRKEFVTWIVSAKRQETRDARVAQAAAKLARGEHL